MPRQSQTILVFLFVYVVVFSPLCQGRSNLVSQLEIPTVSIVSAKSNNQAFQGVRVSSERNNLKLNTEETRISPTIPTCQSSRDCDLDFIRDDCYGLSSNKSLVLCKDSVSPCMCLTNLHDFYSRDPCEFKKRCPFNSACVWSAEFSKSLCIPCELFVSTSGPPSECSIDIIEVPTAPPDRSPTIMEACTDDAHCERDFFCTTRTKDHTDELNCSVRNFYSSCMCIPTHRFRCNLFKPCPLNEMCVMGSDIFFIPLCIATEVVNKSMFPMRHVFIIPRFLFIILLALEVCFTALKLSFQDNTQRKLRIAAGCAFVIESLVGVISTLFQAAQRHAKGNRMSTTHRNHGLVYRGD